MRTILKILHSFSYHSYSLLKKYISILILFMCIRVSVARQLIYFFFAVSKIGIVVFKFMFSIELASCYIDKDIYKLISVMSWSFPKKSKYFLLLFIFHPRRVLIFLFSYSPQKYFLFFPTFCKKFHFAKCEKKWRNFINC